MRLLLLLLPLLFFGCDGPLKNCYDRCWSELHDCRFWCAYYSKTTANKTCPKSCKISKRVCSQNCRAFHLGHAPVTCLQGYE